MCALGLLLVFLLALFVPLAAAAQTQVMPACCVNGCSIAMHRVATSHDAAVYAAMVAEKCPCPMLAPASASTLAAVPAGHSQQVAGLVAVLLILALQQVCCRIAAGRHGITRGPPMQLLPA